MKTIRLVGFSGIVLGVIVAVSAWRGRGDERGGERPHEGEGEEVEVQEPLAEVASDRSRAEVSPVESSERVEPASTTLSPVATEAARVDDDDGEETRELIRPVIAAIRESYGSDQARREAMLTALRNSGESREPWTAYAASTFSGIRRALPELPGVEVFTRHTSCYRAGCEATVVFNDAETYARAFEAFRHVQEPGATHGGRVQTPAVKRPDGRFEGTWIMLRPG